MVNFGLSPITKWFLSSNAAASGGYDALEPRGRRRAPVTAIRHADRDLDAGRRQKLVASTQDAIKNFELAGWMVRKHLDYVTAFTYQFNSGNARIDDAVEKFMNDWSDKRRFDYAGRHGMRRFLRMAEARRVIDGDLGIIKVTSGDGYGKLQSIESDRIRNPENTAKGETWINGVHVDNNGRALGYGVHARELQSNAYQFEAEVSSKSMILHAWWDSSFRFDAVRGVSPLTACLNRSKDLYEGFDYTLAKIKLSQVFGLKITRDLETGAIAEQAADRTVDFGKGPVFLDLDPGEDANFLESATPAAETAEFYTMMTMVMLKALDIPYSFADEAHTNFYGSRGGVMQYIRSCESKINDNRELLTDITRWRLGLAIARGELPGVIESFEDFDEFMSNGEWVSAGVPFWDAAKEVVGYKDAIGAALSNPQLVCRETGTDFYQNVDRIAEAMEYAKSKGVELNYSNAAPGTKPSDPVYKEDDEDGSSSDPEQSTGDVSQRDRSE